MKRVIFILFCVSMLFAQEQKQQSVKEILYDLSVQQEQTKQVYEAVIAQLMAKIAELEKELKNVKR